jgi:hypothetical protein
MSDDVTLGEVNRNLQAMAGDVRELTAYVRAQNGRVGTLETKVAVLEAMGQPTPNKRGVIVVGVGGAGIGAAVASLVPIIKKALGF